MVHQANGKDCVEYLCDGSPVINLNTSAKRCRVQGSGDKDGLVFKNEFDEVFMFSPVTGKITDAFCAV